MPSVTVSIDLATITCCHKGCGIIFGVPNEWKDDRREDHSRFFCPNGHGQSFVSETEAERLGRELATKKAYAEKLEAEKSRLQRDKAAAEEALSRHKKRTANGVCPCCNRSFKNVQRHMKTKHPQFAH